ncbi:DDRGK domain-containing protein 1 [Anastrepha obliqua]|uniref:DDRGK domain-containing protein 1 n=1 Tax=Anastrepha ludens TaxID=28586 RepID=UPI0023AFEB1E|nr:DDRGK domain-containing protein 1 [Anastrepha ludens]XP_054747259.1 DDRGK domain-containing protein 1 [Anastrepha obliqua]
MDLTILIGIATALLVILIGLFLFQKKTTKAGTSDKPAQRGVPIRAQEGVPRRAQIARNQRNRLRQNAAAAAAAAADQAVPVDNVLAANDNDEDGEEGDIPSGPVMDEKMGAKKRAKMEAKEQKRLMREQELIQREERKVKEAKQEAERQQQKEKEEEVERKAAEAERLAREERERKEHEEYLKMKEAFKIEEEGFDEAEEAEKEQQLQDFIQYIKDNKVVVLEDLAMEFKLKTQQVIDRIQDLQANDTLTGVIDDRGKFIYVSQEELLEVAKFIRQRGRVSITELAESSNNLINLTPVSSA